jgi:hypothetical protein
LAFFIFGKKRKGTQKEHMGKERQL